MEKITKIFFKSSIIMSLVLLILGLLLIFQSEATIVTISYIIGAILIALGALAIIKFIKKVKGVEEINFDIVYGIVTIIFGILIIKNPHAIASVIPIVIGIGIIINSATKLQYSFELKSHKSTLWKSTMIISIISTICGIILLFNPFKGAVIITRVIGIFIVIYSVLDIFSTLSIKRSANIINIEIENNIQDAEIIEEESDGDNAKEEKKTQKEKNKKKKKESNNE